MPSAPYITAFEAHRSLLFGIAYRMLGSVTEAEDMVQETFLRWQRQSSEEIQSPKAWLTAAITRLCIDQLRSARRQREEYVGVWLPEPLLEQQIATAAADRQAALADSLSTAFLVLLETLSPAERAVFLLREVFEYDYAEISRIVDKNEANCRQMARRAKEHLASRQTRFEAHPVHSERLVQQFLQTCRQGDTEELLSLLTEDAAIYSDGGGKVPAAPAPILGADRVARFLIGVNKLNYPNWQMRYATVNSAPGALIFTDGELMQTVAFDIVDGRVRALYIVRNPEKLRHLSNATA